MHQNNKKISEEIKKFINLVKDISEENEKKYKAKNQIIKFSEMNIYKELTDKAHKKYIEIICSSIKFKKSYKPIAFSNFGEYQGELNFIRIINTFYVIPYNRKYIFKIQQCESELKERFINITLHYSDLIIYETINFQINKKYCFNSIPDDIITCLKKWIQNIKYEHYQKNIGSNLLKYKNNNILSDIIISF
jgi:hypothetical protein